MGIAGGPNLNQDGLVLCLDASDKNSYPGSGTICYDMSATTTSTLTNGTLFSTNVQGTFIFDGSNDYINIGINKPCNVFTGDFAISVWANRSNTGGTWGNIIGDYYTNSTANANEWQIMMSSAGAFNFYVVGPGYVISPTSNFGANQWHNAVVTRVGSTITMYVNGVSIATATTINTIGTTTGNLNIGIDGNNSAEPFTGNIASVSIYKNKGLTAQEVLQNYNATKSRFGLK